MGYSDFLGMDTDDFAAVVRAYNQREENREHGEWERARMVAFITALPYLKDRNMPAQRFLLFPWEKEESQRGVAAGVSRLTAEEEHVRAMAALKKLGERY